MTTVSYSAMEAAHNGHDTFINMKPCKWGHPAPRLCRRDSGACVECYEMKKSKGLRLGTAAGLACSAAMKSILDRTGSGVAMKAAESALVRTARLLSSGELKTESLVALLDALCPEVSQ